MIIEQKHIDDWQRTLGGYKLLVYEKCDPESHQVFITHEDFEELMQANHEEIYNDCIVVDSCEPGEKPTYMFDNGLFEAIYDAESFLTEYINSEL